MLYLFLKVFLLFNFWKEFDSNHLEFGLGLSCENCVAGFYRNPVNGSSYDVCVPCDCNGRAETVPPDCDHLTGVCMNCRNGTMVRLTF